MTPSPIAIMLDGRRRTYVPGEMLSGEYRWDADPGSQVKAVEVSVLWYTEGKGDEDFGVHFFDRLSVEEGDEVGPRQCARFTTELPKSPLSYEGVIVKIRWCVRVRLFLKRGKVFTRERTFQLGHVPLARPLVAPGRRGVRLKVRPESDELG